MNPGDAGAARNVSFSRMALHRGNIIANFVFFFTCSYIQEDTSFVEFSPKHELKEVYDHVGRKVSAQE